ncbi:SPOR domain-containing protein [Sulfurovum sp.]|uniref:SPOR domain-containing protein n=1 Tax=Sulfurovum sp. TaxID=1969726 RepID=UPI003566612E
MHDHNLDDLIIDNIEPKNNKTKSFLTIIALSIVVLIVAIILTKILLKTPNENSLAFEENTTELIAPELKLKEIPKPQKEKEEPSLPEIIANKLTVPAVETKKPVVIEEPAVVIKKEPVLSNIIDQEIKAPAPETKKPVIVQAPLPTLKEKEAKDAADIAYWKAMQEKRKAEETAKESVTIKETTVVIKKEQTEEVVQIKEPVKPKKVKTAVVKTPKPVVTPVTTTPVPKSVSTTKYYVQVGSFRTNPSSRFISVIKNNGFQYTIKRTSDGTRKLLIGPYKDRASVNRALVNVKDRINKSAFVVKR